MPQVSLVVGHGGHATTMLALAHDLPVAVMPMHPLLDQPMVGQALETAGAGRLLGKEASPDELRPILAELLEAGPIVLPPRDSVRRSVRHGVPKPAPNWSRH